MISDDIVVVVLVLFLVVIKMMLIVVVVLRALGVPVALHLLLVSFFVSTMVYFEQHQNIFGDVLGMTFYPFVLDNSHSSR